MNMRGEYFVDADVLHTLYTNRMEEELRRAMETCHKPDGSGLEHLQRAGEDGVLVK